MKKPNPLAWLLAATLAGGCVATSEYDRVRTDLRGVARENAALQDRVQSLSDELAREKALREQEADALRAQIALLETDKEKTVEKLEKTVEEKKEEIQKTSAAFETMRESLRAEIEAGKIDVTEVAGKLRVRMTDRILFAPGKADLGAEGESVLRRVALTLKNVTDKLVQVEGHTDSQPIRNERYPSNWELSSGRACAVVRFLAESGVDPKRMVAAGFGEHHPVAPNKTAEGRQENRRIEIVLVAPDLERALAEATGKKPPEAAPKP